MDSVREKEMIVFRHVRIRLRSTLFGLLLVLLTPYVLAQATSVLLVLDASGSMFVQLQDGQYRITAAKAALTEFVTRLPDDPDLHVGFRIYGSRIAALEDGACEDSHLFVPVDGFDRAVLLDTIGATRAKGATPIAYSLELAAEDLRDAPGRRIIVLVTDGAESCGGDVRAAVERLTAAGLEVELHIIGFDLGEAAIRSFDGLGIFENTTSAPELAAALGRAVDLTPVIASYPITVTLTRRGQPTTDGATVRFLDAVSGTETTLTSTATATFTTRLPAGSYRAEVADAFAAAPLTVSGLTISPDTDNTFAFELEPAAEVDLTVTPTEPGAGSSVTVHFDGAPDGDRHWITIVPLDAPDSIYLDFAYVSGAMGEATLRLPDVPATLEARYHVALPEGGTQVVGRSAAFTSVPVTATLQAPDEVSAGAAFDVSWTGPNEGGDFVTVVPVDADDTAYRSYVYADRTGPNQLIAAADAGSYEVRYVTGQSNTVLARRPLRVNATTATIEAPAEIAAGSPFDVSWTGPDNQGDYITIVPAGSREGTYLSYTYTRTGSPSRLTAPIDPGAHEIRYVTGQGDRTLVSETIDVR